MSAFEKALPKRSHVDVSNLKKVLKQVSKDLNIQISSKGLERIISRCEDYGDEIEFSLIAKQAAKELYPAPPKEEKKSKAKKHLRKLPSEGKNHSKMTFRNFIQARAEYIRANGELSEDNHRL